MDVTGIPSVQTAARSVPPPPAGPKLAWNAWGMPVAGIDRYGRPASWPVVVMVASADGFTQSSPPDAWISEKLIPLLPHEPSSKK